MMAGNLRLLEQLDHNQDIADRQADGDGTDE